MSACFAATTSSAQSTQSPPVLLHQVQVTIDDTAYAALKTFLATDNQLFYSEESAAGQVIRLIGSTNFVEVSAPKKQGKEKLLVGASSIDFKSLQANYFKTQFEKSKAAIAEIEQPDKTSYGLTLSDSVNFLWGHERAASANEKQLASETYSPVFKPDSVANCEFVGIRGVVVESAQGEVPALVEFITRTGYSVEMQNEQKVRLVLGTDFIEIQTSKRKAGARVIKLFMKLSERRKSSQTIPLGKTTLYIKGQTAVWFLN